MTNYAHARVNILGVNVSAINMLQATRLIEEYIISMYPTYVCVTPAHGIMECQHDHELRTIFNASGLTTPDGMSIVYLLRLKGFKHVTRVYGPDLMETVCMDSCNGKGYRHFLYGGAPGVVDKLKVSLQSRYPGLQIVGTYTPPFRPLTDSEDQAVVETINTSKSDIVWVGISTPKQERWMADHLGRINSPVMIGVGAAFDFLSGNKKQAPRWIQRSGMEWLFRLISEPRRLWRRYAEYPLFVLLVLAQALGVKSFAVESQIPQEEVKNEV